MFTRGPALTFTSFLFACIFLITSLSQKAEGAARCKSSEVGSYGSSDNHTYTLVDSLRGNYYGKRTLKQMFAGQASRVILGTNKHQDVCPIDFDATNSSNADLPPTSTSAIVSTNIGDYIVYGIQEPSTKLASYELNWGGRCGLDVADQIIGKTPLITEAGSSVFHLEVVDDLINTDKPRPLLVALSQNAFSSAFEVLTDNNYFSLSKCRQVFEFKHLVQVTTLAVQQVGTIIAFANNNPDPTASHSEQLAPVYVARAGEIQFCGLANVERTTDVTLWFREEHLMLAYIQKIGNSRRCVIRFFEILFDKHHNCQDIVPWDAQPSIGNAAYNGTTCPLAQATEVFTLDNILCGCEALKVVQNDTLSYLVVGLANTANEEDGALSCPLEEKLSFNGSATDNVCGCRYAQNISFVLPYNSTVKKFDYFNYYDNSTFQTLDNGPDQVTEITPLFLKGCCLAFQTASDRGDTKLYTVDLVKVVNETDLKPQVDFFLNVDLPPYVRQTSWAYCNDYTIFLSYTREAFITGDSIYRLQCNNKDDRLDFLERFIASGYGNIGEYQNANPAGYGGNGAKPPASYNGKPTYQAPLKPADKYSAPYNQPLPAPYAPAPAYPESYPVQPKPEYTPQYQAAPPATYKNLPPSRNYPVPVPVGVGPQRIVARTTNDSSNRYNASRYDTTNRILDDLVEEDIPAYRSSGPTYVGGSTGGYQAVRFQPMPNPSAYTRPAWMIESPRLPPKTHQNYNPQVHAPYPGPGPYNRTSGM